MFDCIANTGSTPKVQVIYKATGDGRWVGTMVGFSVAPGVLEKRLCDDV